MTREFSTPVGVENLFIETAGGKRVHAWLVDPAGGVDDGAPIVVFCHGNTTQVDSILPMVRPMIDRSGVRWLLVSYRGYGRSDGLECVTRGTIVRDAAAAIDAAFERTDSVGVMGYSAGGVAALGAAASRAGVRAVAVGGTYDTADNLLRASGRGSLTWLISSAYDPARSIRKLGDRPVYIVHGKADGTIAYPAAERLYKSALDAGIDATLYLAEGANHRTILSDDPEVGRLIADFFAAELSSPTAR